jgi:hypothetical protein
MKKRTKILLQEILANIIVVLLLALMCVLAFQLVFSNLSNSMYLDTAVNTTETYENGYSHLSNIISTHNNTTAFFIVVLGCFMCVLLLAMTLVIYNTIKNKKKIKI